MSAELTIRKYHLEDGHERKRLILSGEIRQGDAKKLASVISNNSNWINTIELNSPGGNVMEAMIMGEVVRSARLETIVQPGQTCASACFIIWINGSSRIAFPDEQFKNSKTGNYSYSRIGLHRPYITEINNNDKSLSFQARVMQSVDFYLASRRLPRRIIDQMMSRASNDIYWIKQDDLDEIGFTPYDLEELYIAKCNDNRKTLGKQISIAKANGNHNLESILTDNYLKINDCVNDLNENAKKRAVKEMFKSAFENNL